MVSMVLEHACIKFIISNIVNHGTSNKSLRHILNEQISLDICEFKIYLRIIVRYIKVNYKTSC